MVREDLHLLVRENKKVKLSTDLVVVGGGIAGVCAAIAAARNGIQVVLVQDRPVLGGNASSEVRLWVLGATSHLGNNNRWSREGGIIDELLIENLYRNKEGNTIIFDTILLEKVIQEKNITLLLNTAVFGLDKKGETSIHAVKAFCPQNSTEYTIQGKLFCDASGDGIVGYMAGASYRVGAETKEEFNEEFTPTKEYGELLGHTIYFYSKDTGKPVKYIPPSYALKDITQIPRFKNIKTGESGCQFWWFEYGGRGDTIHDTEEIKWKLWSVVYGVWDYIKNSGKFPEAETFNLEWVGTIPGKRESRRFEGYYMLKQQDIVEQKQFYDAVSFGGWAIDLHPSDGVFSDLPGCNQYHSKGIYQIPYRCFITKDIDNLFLAGRLISASHVAFGSTRVMATCGHGGQVVGTAAALCLQMNKLPKDFILEENIKCLQNNLNLAGQSIPLIPIPAEQNLLSTASIQASSHLALSEMPADGHWYRLNASAGQLLPLKKNTTYSFEISVDAEQLSTLDVEWKISSKKHNYTPDQLVEKLSIPVSRGIQKVVIPFKQQLEDDQYAFLNFKANPDVKLKTSSHRLTGVLSVFHKTNPAVNNYGKQDPPPNSGFESFEFWCPERRPKGLNFGLSVSPAINSFHVENIMNGYTRPYIQPNAWVADINDEHPFISIKWDTAQTIRSITLYFDNDFDHPLESSQMGHPEDRIPFCIKNYKIFNGAKKLLLEKKDNYQTINKWTFNEPLVENELIIEVEHPSSNIPSSIFQIHID